jgi:hypothetical protein
MKKSDAVRLTEDLRNGKKFGDSLDEINTLCEPLDGLGTPDCLGLLKRKRVAIV